MNNNQEEVKKFLEESNIHYKEFLLKFLTKYDFMKCEYYAGEGDLYMLQICRELKIPWVKIHALKLQKMDI